MFWKLKSGISFQPTIFISDGIGIVDINGVLYCLLIQLSKSNLFLNAISQFVAIVLTKLFGAINLSELSRLSIERARTDPVTFLEYILLR